MSIAMWLIGLAVGIFFGFFWGYHAGQNAAVIVTLPATTEKESERQ